MPVAYLTRKEHFSACHRLHTPLLSDGENKQNYGKCNNLNGHGHNYNLEVTVRGEIDAVTGMVLNLQELKHAIKVAALEPLDHKNIDKDVEYFRNVVSSMENIAVFIWDGVKAALSDSNLLYEVKINETENNIVVYRGEAI